MKEREMRVFLKIILLNLAFVLSCQQVSPEVDFPIEPEVSQVNLSSIEEESSELESSSSEEETSELETSSLEGKSSKLQFSSAQDKSKCNITNYKEFVDDFWKVEKIVRETGCKDKECIGKGCQLAGADFSNQDLRGFIFNNANLKGANFKGSNIDDAQFIEADLTGANLEGQLWGANFVDALLENAIYDPLLEHYYRAHSPLGISFPEKRGMIGIQKFIQGEMRKKRGEYCTAENYKKYVPNLTACDLEAFDFSGQDLTGFIFDYAYLYEADFNRSKLRGASFKKAVVWWVDFRGADLREANLETDIVSSYFGRFGYFETFILYGTSKLENATYDTRYRVYPHWTHWMFLGGRGIRFPEKRGMINTNSVVETDNWDRFYF
ncbi:MAG: pentapeptide repeat-containing protein [Bdellovibrionales bacterium]|nr:pentapeptide repeat-containing protein [Bdellovibrionales bacterium]